MFSRLILLFLLCATNFSWAANNIALIDDNHSDFDVSKSAQYIIDETGELTIDNIASEAYTSQFLPVNDRFLQLGLVKGNIWLRTEVAIRITKNEPVLLEVSAPRLEYLNIYIPNLYGSQAQARLGEARPYSSRLVEHPNYLFPMPNATPPIFTVYIKLSSHLPINARIHLKTLSQMSLDSQKDFSFTGLLMGILLVLFVSNLFFYLKSSHPMYILYSLLLLGIALLHLALHGQLSQFFPDRIGIQERIYNFAALSCGVAITFFSRLYLDTKSYFPNIDKAMIALGVINAIGTAIFTIEPQLINIFFLSLMTFSTLFFLTALAVYAFLKHSPFSGYYLIARVVLLLGYSIWIMSAYGVLPNPSIYEWGLTIAIIIEAMIHFTGMIAQLNPLLRHHVRLTRHSQTKLLDLLSDLSSRLRRQLNVIDGSFAQIERNITNERNKPLVHNGQVANNNLQNLAERLDYYINAEQNYDNSLATEQSLPVFLNNIIDDAYNSFQQLDQDNASIDIIVKNANHVELLHNAELIQRLIEAMLLEFKYYTDQTLTLEITRQDLEREGITALELRCYPLPTRVSPHDSSVDLGMSYIMLLVEQLNATTKTTFHEQARALTINIPIHAHVRQMNLEQKEDVYYDLVLFGQHDADLQQAFNILQAQPYSIEHFSLLDELLSFLDKPETRRNGSVIVLFDNGGHIPHISCQKIRPLMRPEDQCLLITNNVKMSRDYAKTIGFDELIPCSALEAELLQQLLRLTRKGERLRTTLLPRIKPLRTDT
ncbi:7TMR-DISM family protein [Marinomonas pollencensis]|uniref:7TMR-DISM extracellular protein 2 n=1 Tax=Marinomonas pollencensis TaxID=491954 RepID=A0A3E0DQ01_9GAMM|nr:7TM diverse intracellular signaling domain-containing protein [Marinomonas pollencensis]REG84322.1 7TMR-DISM extracellular protein 2 [Marinomonas pollencensis]